MIRRSFRIGLWLGLFAGIAVAVAKLSQSRQAAPALAPTPPPRPAPPRPAPAARTEPWPRLETVPAAEPVAPVAAAPAPAPPRPAPPRPAPPRPAPEPARWSEESVSALEPHADDPPAAAPAPPRTPAPRPVAKAAPAKKAPAKKAVPKVVAAWVDPKGNICPKSHPVKAKLVSKIFQVPGHFAYDRTNPDRCYKNPKLAEGDGFRSAKR